MSDFNYSAAKCLNYKKNNRQKQIALKALNNYLDQLKIHYDLTENDLIKILKIVLKIKNKKEFIKNLWNIFK
ncbi:MAG TPA: hypothetical protein P5556_09675 [Candidatus Gastranaerophilales bacterium]|nr:hypothetical protein [Candidatus Gastranaerophilales bacterium]